MENHTNATKDRNFDDLAAHFTRKIYASHKGHIRLEILKEDLAHIKPKRTLDMACGLGQMAHFFAERGIDVLANDLSAKMIESARLVYAHPNICYQVGDFRRIEGAFDLILCHALLEWLADPWAGLNYIKTHLTKGGYASICFYNAHGATYRNLIMGNFYQINAPKARKGRTLTPTHPIDPDALERQLERLNMTVVSKRGIRVFYDYAKKEGGNRVMNDVLAMEKRFGRMAPYRDMGRYLHWLVTHI